MARKNRERKASDLRRKKGTRRRYDRMLIVCEGSKTEPNYFEEIRQEARIPSADIKVLHSAAGTAPIRVVEFAIEEFGKTKGYERVYAVFDRDDHASYANAIHKATATNLRNDENHAVAFAAAVSVPCFELWFLLHFVEIRTYDHRDAMLHRLRGFVPGYDKGRRGMYALTKPALQLAIQRAAWLRANFSRLPGDEAYTDVDELTTRLVTLRD